MRRLFTLSILVLSFNALFSQTVKIYGTVTDEKDSAMIGVTVAIKGTTIGTVTDTTGNYSLEVEPGTHTVEFSYVGYAMRTFLVTALEVKEKHLDAKMTEEGKQLDIVVVTGTKYEKKLGEEVASMEVVKADMIQASNSKMDEAMNRVPGVNMMGKSISIRGGSGFADVTSNRVLVMLDDMPIISPENGGIIWDMLPLEELEQVEIIKGSSSSLYGSSALDGVINLISANPKPEGETKILLSYGLYDQPNNKAWDWWWRNSYVNNKGKLVTKFQPKMFGGGSIFHRKQYGDIGVVLSGAYQQNQNYLQNDEYLIARLGMKLRYIPHKNPHLTTGVNMNFFYKISKDFFAGKNIDSGAYEPFTTPSDVKQRAINIDPYLNYYDEHDNRHSLKLRVFNVAYFSSAVPNFASGDSTISTEYFIDYTFTHNFRKADLIITAGASASYSVVRGKTFAIDNVSLDSVFHFSTRDVKNTAVFIQFEKKFFHKLTLSGGLRAEYAQLADTTVQNRLPLINLITGHGPNDPKSIYSPITPLGRIGLNYQATEGTFLRGSFGQGFRYPALAEKYVYTLRSGAEVYPNDSLKPENGWMAEIGIKQGVKISKWMAYFDLSGFFMRYHDLIEFEGYNDYPASLPPPVGVPFQAQNVDNARIAGTEFSTVANGKIFGIPLTFLIGYTYIYPQNMSYDPSDPNSTPLLKYRIQHSVKADIQSNYKGLVLGISAFYNSFMKYIDNQALGAIPIVSEFRKTHDKGDYIMDFRVGYDYRDKATFTFICKNVLDTEYMLQPGVIEAPRNYTFQLGYNF